MKFNKSENQLINLIPKGNERTVSLADLVKLTNINSRKLRALIFHLVTVQHVPIAGVHGQQSGYFIVTNEEERNQALQPLVSQVSELQKRIQAITDTKLKKPLQLNDYHTNQRNGK